MRHSLRQDFPVPEVVMEVISRGQSDALRAHIVKQNPTQVRLSFKTSTNGAKNA
jgi:hypothetical protein